LHVKTIFSVILHGKIGNRWKVSEMEVLRRMYEYKREREREGRIKNKSDEERKM
jgi:hypothetical protein